MTHIYSVDFRERVLETYHAGTPASEIAKILHVSPRTIYRWDALEKAMGSVTPRPRPGRPRLIQHEDEDQLRCMVMAHPAATLSEYCREWEQLTRVHIGRSAMCAAINHLGLVRKKECDRQ